MANYPGFYGWILNIITSTLIIKKQKKIWVQKSKRLGDDGGSERARKKLKDAMLMALKIE